jgi:hypothetical protein
MGLEEEGMEPEEEGTKLKELFASCASDFASREKEGMSLFPLFVPRELKGMRLEESIGSRGTLFTSRQGPLRFPTQWA